MAPTTKHKRLLDQRLREQLVELGQTQGFRRIAGQIGLHPQTIATICAGFSASTATVALVERWLNEDLRQKEE